MRDEVHEVAPGVFLGLTYLRKPAGLELAVFFFLDARRGEGGAYPLASDT